MAGKEPPSRSGKTYRVAWIVRITTFSLVARLRACTGACFAGMLRGNPSDLQNVSVARDQFVQYRIDEEAEEEPRDQAGDDYNRERPLCV